jgi:glycosyltransferase involved in cell wall biosynthesis
VEPPVVIGSVGRLDAVKAYDQLLHAFHRLRERTPNVRLRIAGDGPERKTLQAVRCELGLESCVDFLGEVSNIEPVYRSFDIFVLPSVGEGMSNTILEAMASALPIVATNVGGNSELIIPEESGILCRVGDLEALVSGLERYVRDAELRLRHAHAARRRCEEHFALRRMVVSYQDIYELVGRSAPRAVDGAHTHVNRKV